jgi:hypothetical protein
MLQVPALMFKSPTHLDDVFGVIQQQRCCLLSLAGFTDESDGYPAIMGDMVFQLPNDGVGSFNHWVKLKAA